VERLPQELLSAFRRNPRQLRHAAGWSQEALAERAEITLLYLQMIEVGQFGCSLAVLVRLQSALRCDWNMLLRDVTWQKETPT
jgi:transcriptional regulator with XRE-family HTH domain